MMVVRSGAGDGNDALCIHMPTLTHTPIHLHTFISLLELWNY